MPFDPNDPDTKAALKAAVDEAVSEMTADIDAIKKNRDQLLKEKKELQRSATITPEQLAAVEAERDKATADLAAAQKAAKDATTAAEKAQKALEAEQGVTHKLVADSGLRELLLKGGVTDPDFLDMACGKYLPGVKVVVDGDTRKAMHGDKPLEDFVKELLASDAGKKIIAAPLNSGGGAGGGSSEGGGKTMTRTAYQELATSEPAKANAFVREGGKIVDQAA